MRDNISTVGDNISTVLQYCGGYSVHWGTFSTVGDNFSTVGDNISTMEWRLDGCPGWVQYSVCIGWYTNFILGIHIYLLAIAICGITGCYGHLVTMLCFLSNLRDISLSTGGGGQGPAKSVYIEKVFYLTVP